jgi:hypothetical protein
MKFNLKTWGFSVVLALLFGIVVPFTPIGKVLANAFFYTGSMLANASQDVRADQAGTVVDEVAQLKTELKHRLAMVELREQLLRAQASAADIRSVATAQRGRGQR